MCRTKVLRVGFQPLITKYCVIREIRAGSQQKTLVYKILICVRWSHCRVVGEEKSISKTGCLWIFSCTLAGNRTRIYALGERYSIHWTTRATFHCDYKGSHFLTKKKMKTKTFSPALKFAPTQQFSFGWNLCSLRTKLLPSGCTHFYGFLPAKCPDGCDFSEKKLEFFCLNVQKPCPKIGKRAVFWGILRKKGEIWYKTCLFVVSVPDVFTWRPSRRGKEM